MGGVQLRRRLLARGNFRLLPAGDGLLLPCDYSRRMQRLAATLQQCLMNIHAKIILFHVRRGSMLK